MEISKGGLAGVASSGASPPAQAPEAPKRSFMAVMGEGQSAHAHPQTPTANPAAASAEPARPDLSVRKVMQGAIDAEKRIESILKAAANGKTFTPAELLAVQAEVFRYSQTVEVISRTADKLIGGVKQILGTQV